MRRRRNTAGSTRSSTGKKWTVRGEHTMPDGESYPDGAVVGWGAR